MGVEWPINYAQVTLVFTLTGDAEEMVTTFGVAPDLGFSATLIATHAVTAARAADGPFLASQILGGYTFQGARAALRTLDGMETGEDFTAPQTGTKSGNPLPSNCSELWTKRTALGGRRNKGRNYIPPVYFSEADVDPRGAITVSMTTRQAVVTQFVTKMAELDVPLVLFHSDGGVPTSITGLTVNSLIATQRERMR